MNKSQVKVTAKDGKVVIPNTTPGKEDTGYIRVEQKIVSMENGFASVQNRSALIRGKVEILKSLGHKEGDVLAGKIYIKESTKQSYPEQEAKINPQTLEEVTHQGMPIYRESFFTADPDKADELLANDKVEATTMETSPSKKEASEAL